MVGAPWRCNDTGQDEGWSPPAGDWLAQHGGGAGGLDLAALAEASDLGLDSRVRGSVLSALRRDPPPRFAEAQAQAAALVSRWEATPSTSGSSRAGAGAGGRRPGSGPRSRSASRGPPLPADVAAPSLPSPSGSVEAVPVASLSPPPGALPRLRGHGGPSDDSLLGSMAARLAQVEQLNRQMSAKLAAQTQELESLRAQVAGLPPALESGAAAPGSDVAMDNRGSAAPREVALLRAENGRLKLQVEELRQFVADYGLTWLPRQADADGNEAPVSEASGTPVAAIAPRFAPDRPGARAAAPGGAITVDIQVIRARVEGLNATLETDGHQVLRKQVGGINQASLATDAALPLPLTFFSDGVKLADRAFMPYESVPAQKVLKDVLDGYFPSALQEQHPGGVALKVIDRTGNGFRDWVRDLARNDPELADGGERLRPAGSVGKAVKAPADERSAGERLLAKLPERVIRGGKVCEIRGPIAEQLGLGARGRCASEPAAAGTAEAVAAARPQGNGDVSLLEAGRDPEAPVARLQVKLETGHRVTLMMENHATIGALWEALDRWRSQHSLARAGADGRRCSLRTAFPPKAYVDRAQTLEAAGLTPSAAMFVSAEAAAA